MRFNSMTSYNEKQNSYLNYVIMAIALAFVFSFFLNIATQLIVMLAKLIIQYWWISIILFLLLMFFKKFRRKK